MKEIKEDAMNETRKRLIINDQRSWWGILGLRLTIEATTAVQTAETNGVKLRYNPEWFNSLPRPIQDTVCAHEIEHCALGHMFRVGSRDLHTANIAMDHVVNLDLRAAGFQLPTDFYADPKYTGMSFEKVYAIIQQEKLNEQEKERQEQEQKPEQEGDEEQDQQEGQDGTSSDDGPEEEGKGEQSGQDGEDETGTDGKPGEGGTEPGGAGNSPGTSGDGKSEPSDPCNWGQVVPAPADLNEDGDVEDAGDLEREWEKAVETATLVASKAGNMPSSLKENIAEGKVIREDLIPVLQRYMTAKKDYSYSTPEKRFIGRGLYLPGPVKSSLTDLVFGIDTSGSVSRELLAFFGNKVREVLAMDNPPERIWVIYCDAVVHRVDEIEQGEVEFKMEAPGRGGTSFQPVFEKVTELGIRPDALIYLTDLEGSAPAEPDYPTLWVCPIGARYERPPFGELVKVDPFN